MNELAALELATLEVSGFMELNGIPRSAKCRPPRLLNGFSIASPDDSSVPLTLAVNIPPAAYLIISSRLRGLRESKFYSDMINAIKGREFGNDMADRVITTVEHAVQY